MSGPITYSSQDSGATWGELGSSSFIVKGLQRLPVLPREHLLAADPELPMKVGAAASLLRLLTQLFSQKEGSESQNQKSQLS